MLYRASYMDCRNRKNEATVFRIGTWSGRAKVESANELSIRKWPALNADQVDTTLFHIVINYRKALPISCFEWIGTDQVKSGCWIKNPHSTLNQRNYQLHEATKDIEDSRFQIPRFQIPKLLLAPHGHRPAKPIAEIGRICLLTPPNCQLRMLQGRKNCWFNAVSRQSSKTYTFCCLNYPWYVVDLEIICKKTWFLIWGILSGISSWSWNPEWSHGIGVPKS